MKKLPLHSAKFFGSFTGENPFPSFKDAHGGLLPELALIGRSNVGKSSFLNSFFGKKLARVSATPGKTQMCNFYLVENSFCLVDLPGYGWADVPKELLKNWDELMERYFQQRSHQQLLFFFDVRREPNELDFHFAKWAAFYKKEPIVIVTKVDKVKAAEKEKCKKLILFSLFKKELPCVYFSCKTGEGLPMLRSMMERIICPT